MTPLRVQEWGTQNTCLKDASALTTGDLADARLSSNVPLKGASNTFTGNQVFAGTAPLLRFHETDATANAGQWRLQATFDSLFLSTEDDAASTTTILRIQRSGATPGTIDFENGTLQNAGSNVLTVSGVAAAPAINVSGLAATDGIYVDDAGTAKRMSFQDMGLRFVSNNANQTFALSDANTAQAVGATARTYTVPPNSSVAFNIGTIIGLVSTGAGTITVDPGAGVTLNSVIAQASTGNRTVLAGGMALLYKVGTNVWNLTGDIS